MNTPINERRAALDAMEAAAVNLAAANRRVEEIEKAREQANADYERAVRFENIARQEWRKATQLYVDTFK